MCYLYISIFFCIFAIDKNKDSMFMRFRID